MKRNRAFIWVLVGAGLALVVLLLAVSSVAAGHPSPRLVVHDSPGLLAETAGAPTFYSSGWEPINQGQTLTFSHNLGLPPEEYAVELWFWDADGGRGINRYGYGGVEADDKLYGAYWQNLTANTIEVYRQPDDTAADQIRINVWVPPAAPGYDSLWKDISKDQTLTFNHNLGITATELTVVLWFSGTRGIHHYAYGGLVIGTPPELQGAYWRNLTNTSVQVTRQRDDTYVEQVRVFVAQAATPDYDSGWQDIAPGAELTYTHRLNWDPNMLLVRGECYDPTPGGLGIHQKYAGGYHDSNGWQGTHLQNLAYRTVRVVRQANDSVCPQSRVIITKRRIQTYLPLVLRNS